MPTGIYKRKNAHSYNFIGRVKNKAGFWLVYNPEHPLAQNKGHVLEHRLVMETFLGRHLSPREKVYHKNHIKHDNRIENLILMPSIRSWNKGKKMSVEFCKKIGDVQRGKPRPDRQGDKSPWWKGGVTPISHKVRKSFEYKSWREAVFKRDNWTCQKTIMRGIRLHPHHILNFSKYPELRLVVDNGITLSEKAHKEFHKKYGFKNNTKEQIEEFLSTGVNQ